MIFGGNGWVGKAGPLVEVEVEEEEEDGGKAISGSFIFA
jgi:hypothetical protein